MGVRSLGREDPLKEEMATPSRILAWEIPWAEEPGGLRSMGSHMTDRLNAQNLVHENIIFLTIKLHGYHL